MDDSAGVRVPLLLGSNVFGNEDVSEAHSTGFN